MKLKHTDYIIKEEFTEKELDIFLDLVSEKGFDIEEDIKDYNYYPLTFWQLEEETLVSYESEFILDDEDNMTVNFKHYLKSLQNPSDVSATAPEKPFSRDDLEDGMVLSLGGIPHLFFVMFGGVHKALTSEKFCFMADLDAVTDEWMVYLSDSPTKITKVEYQGKVLFDRAKEDELECLLEQQKDIESKIKQLKGL